MCDCRVLSVCVQPSCWQRETAPFDLYHLLQPPPAPPPRPTAVQITFKRLDGDIRSLQQSGGREGDADVRLQVQRQLAQALFKLSVEFRWAGGGGTWGGEGEEVLHGRAGGCGRLVGRWFEDTSVQHLTSTNRPVNPQPTNRRKEETRYLNKIEAQKGYEKGSSIGLIEDDASSTAVAGGGYGGGGGSSGDPGFTQAQLIRMTQAESLIEERDQEIKKVRLWIVYCPLLHAAAGWVGYQLHPTAPNCNQLHPTNPPKRNAPGGGDHRRAGDHNARPLHAGGGAGDDAGPCGPQHH